MSCCNTGNGFPDAGLALQLGRNHAVIWAEICAIQQAILQSFCGSNDDCIGCGTDSRCVTVGGETPMTFVKNIESVTVVDGGSGYIDPVVVVLDDFGSGAELEVILNGTTIESVNVINGGSNYTQSATATAIADPDNINVIVDATFTVVAKVNPWCTNPESYNKVITYQCDNKTTQDQLDQVTTYFKKLGYEIVPLTNPDTGNTIIWRICW